MATRLSLAEQIQRLYKRSLGSDAENKGSIDRREIFPIINQVANELLATTMMANISAGNTGVPSAMLATFSNIEVKNDFSRYYINLPVHPIILPRNIGVYSIVPQSGHPHLLDGAPYIPITQEDWDLLSVSDLNNSGMLEGQTAFYVEGRKAFFTKQPTAKVKVKLIVSDPSFIGDNDPYPITPEMEATLIERVLEIIKGNTGGPQQPKPQDR